MKASPYITSNWVEREQFYGREELCQLLLNTSERCCYLAGTRRIGKTSLMRRLAALLSPHALYCDLMQAAGQLDGQDVLDESRLIRLLRRELARQAAQSEPLAATRALWDRGEARLVPWLEELSWAWEEHGLVLTLLWDEAEMLRMLPVTALMQLRALLQHTRSLRLTVCASKGLAAINDLWREADVSPFLFGFRTYYIAGLSDQDANLLISQRGSVPVSPELQENIRTITGNHPYLIQSLCDKLYANGTLREPQRPDLLVDPIMADLFRIDVQRLSPSEQTLINTLAEHGALDAAALREASGLPDEAFHSFAQGLAQLGYIRRLDDERWRVGNAMLAQWLRGHPAPAASPITDMASLEVVDQELQRLGLARVSMRRRMQELKAGVEQPEQRSLSSELDSLQTELQSVDQQLEQRRRQTLLLAQQQEPLSERELEVLRLLAAGLRNGEIARRLIVSENTVKAHIKHIYRKLGVNDRVQAAHAARALGLL